MKTSMKGSIFGGRLKLSFLPRSSVPLLVSFTLTVAYNALILTVVILPVLLSPGQSLGVYHPLQQNPKIVVDFEHPAEVGLLLVSTVPFDVLPVVEAENTYTEEIEGDSDAIRTATLYWHIAIVTAISIELPTFHTMDDCTWFRVWSEGNVVLDLSDVNGFIPEECGYRVPTSSELEIQMKSEIDSEFNKNQAGPGQTERLDKENIEEIIRLQTRRSS